MQKQSRFKGLLAIFISLLFIWGLFYLSYLLLKSSTDTNLTYLPKDAEIIIHIDGRKLAKNVASDLLFTSQDKVVVDKLIKFINKETEDGFVQKTGIDFFSEIGFFVKTINNDKIIGVLVNVKSSEKFIQNASKMTNAVVAYSDKENVGVLIFKVSPTNKLTHNELQKLANKILLGKSSNPFKNSSHENALVEINTNNSMFGKGSISITEENNSFILESTLQTKKAAKNTTTYLLKPKGLHLSCAMIPNDYFRIFENFLPISNKNQLPKLKSLSCNYAGLHIQEGGNHDLGFYVQPMTEMLIEFEQPFHLNQHIQFKDKFVKWGIKTNEKGLTIGRKSYVVDSLSPTSYFIGINTSNLIKQKNPYLLNMEGNLSNVLKISGSESISTFVEMIFPAFNPSKDFFKSIENTSIQMKEIGSHIQTKGQLKFKKNKYAYTECVRFMLALKGY